MTTTRPDVALNLLGGFILEREGAVVAGRAVQRRRLAVLALLAGSPGGTLSRDRIIGLLWPDAAADQARHLLNDAIYALRRALGDDLIISRGDDLVLNRMAVHCDVFAFEDALAADDLARATQIYRGEYAHGLFVSDAPEFAHWLDRTRAEYRLAWRSALERLALRDAAAGNGSAAAARWERLALDDVGDERFVIAAILAMVKQGRRGAALRLAREHGRVMEELGAAPGPLVAEAVAGTQRPDEERGPRTAAGRSDREQRLSEKQRPNEDQRPTSSAGWPERLFWAQRAAGAGLALAGLLFVAVSTSRERGSASVEEERTALLEGWPKRPANVLVRHAVQETASPAAMRGLFAGERAWRAGRMRTAVEEFERAARADSSLALAWYRLSQASLAADLPEAITLRADSMVTTLASRTAMRERFLLRAYRHFRMGDAETAEQLYRTLVAQYPEFLEGWLQLGETLFHYNPVRGRSLAEAEPAFTRALALDPDNWVARWHLALLAGVRGDFTTHLDVLDQMAAQGAIEPAQRAQLTILRGAARGQLTSPAVRDALGRLDELWLYRTAWVTAVYQQDQEATEAIGRALAYGSQALHPRTSGLGILLLAAIRRGAWAEVERLTAQVAATHPAPAMALSARVTAALAPLPSRPAIYVAETYRLVSAPWPENALEVRARHLWLGLLARQMGATDAALAEARALERMGGDAALIRSMLALDRGDAATALAILTRPEMPVWLGRAATEGPVPKAFERLVRAEALERLGRPQEAAAWRRSLAEHSLGDLALAGRSS
jgi:DNA-binding SARP family transcriptional activator